LQSESKIQNFK